MITFSTINEEIQKTLFDKMSMLERDSSVSDIGVTTNYPIGETIATSGGDTRQNYMFARSVFMRMISLTPPVKSNGSKGKPIVLMGGEASLIDGQYGITHNLGGEKGSRSHPEKWGMVDTWVEKEGTPPQPDYSNVSVDEFAGGWGTMTYGDATGDSYQVNEPVNTKLDEAWTEQFAKPGKYWTAGEAQPFRPMPGVKDVSVEYVGGGMKLGAAREAQINWTCWTFADLDRMMPHFLHHGKTIFIDWGWSGVGELKNVAPYNIFDDTGGFKDDPKIDHIIELQKWIATQKGNYDAMIGIVKNFEWQVRDDGGFDCVTTLTSTGVNILKQNLKTASDPRLNALPMFMHDTVKDKEEETGVSGNVHTTTILTPELTIKTPEKGDLEEVTIDASSRTGGGLKGSSTSAGTVMTVRGGPDAVKAYAPYINFDIYLDDIENQMDAILKSNKEVIKSGHIIKLDKSYTISRDYIGGFFHYIGWSDGSKKTQTQSRKISGTYVTWGWFEDNVLSRFFSKSVASGTSVIGTIRSIEDIGEDIIDPHTKKPIDVSGEFVGGKEQNLLLYRIDPNLRDTKSDVRKKAWENFQSSSGTKRSVLIRNHPNMLMTDSSKFLIANLTEGSDFQDPCEKFIQDSWGTWQKGKPFYTEGGVDKPVPKQPEMWWPGEKSQPGSRKQLIHGTKTPYGTITLSSGLYKDNAYINEEEKKIKVHYFRDKSNPNSGHLRNVYFNVKHLKEMMKGATSVEKAILAVWDDFSNEYGGIYTFKLEFSDEGNQIMIKDDGWTMNTVKDLLEDRSHLANPDAAEGDDDEVNKFDGLFEFPTWEKSSIVKSQNLSAKLPSRMQVAAMYGSQNKSEEKEVKGQEKVQTWDERKSMAWGRLTAPLNERLAASQNLTREQFSRKVLADVISGGYDFPYKENQKFGSATADITKPLGIGEASDGTVIQDSIIDNLMQHHYDKYLTKQKAIVEQLKLQDEQAATDETAAADAATKLAELKQKQEAYDSVMSGAMDVSPKDMYTYESKPGAYEKFFLDPLFRNFMIEAMKGGDNGIISRNDPIVPVDFDIEIDGIAGIYPGNAFQSSYLPTRYKEMACFQAMGVDHKVDSSGWTSTIKGQIRVSIESQIDEDKIDKEEEFEETKDWTPPESPGNPNIPFPINLDLDILGELNTDGFDLDLEVGASYENTDEEPPPYVSSGVGEDMELRMTDEQGEAGYVGGREVGPSMDADFSSFDMRRAADDNDWPGAVPQPYIEGPHEFMFGERAWNTGALPNSVVEVAGTARTIVNQATNILTLGNHLANQYPNMTWEWTSNESGWQNLYIDGILSVDDNLTDWIRAGATAHDWYNAWVISKVNYSGD